MKSIKLNGTSVVCPVSLLVSTVHYTFFKYLTHKRICIIIIPIEDHNYK